MKRIIIVSLVSILSIVLLYGFSDAAVSGSCVACHTMHNSQNGVPMNLDNNAIPNATLLRGNCAGCHAQNTANNVVTLSGANIPQVLHTAATDLAGGNFHYFDGMSGTQNKVHNVSDLPSPYNTQDAVLLNSPPGYLSGYDPSSGKFNTSNRLSCAGANGCHGNRDQTDENLAIKGAHHTDDTVLKFGTINETNQGASVGTSYRFLYKVHGGEASDWQNTNSTHHNEYKGAAFGGRGQTQNWATVVTISDLCAECHGKFHAGGLTSDSGIGTASPWLRHPTDAVLPGTGEYTSISTTYNVTAPVGRQSIPNNMTTAVAISGGTADTVTCLSCHQAHGSSYPDILRWDYTNHLAAGTGCLVCHTGKSSF
jgi:predicted CXXCH cytochrome family protein